MNPQSTPSRFPTRRLAAAAALSCGTLLAACGGGGSDTPPTQTVSPLSQSDATADSANASSTGNDTAASLDAVIDTTAALAQAVAQPGSATTSDRVRPLADAPVNTLTVSCAGGGTASLLVTEGTAGTLFNGQLDAGEHYSVTYTQCTGHAGWAQLNGSVEMEVTAADQSTTPTTLAVNLAVTNLALTLPSGSATLNGTATVSRSVVTTDGSTTTTSRVAVPSATLATAFNARSGSFTLSNLDATRTLTSVAGVTTASQYSGSHTLSGTAGGRTFSYTVSTTGNVSYDATGALASGAWTVVRPDATIATTVANGTVVITVDDGNNGSIDHTWTFPASQLDAAAG